MDAQELIGWTSSFVLALTIGTQVWRQWQTGTSEGVSPLLFVGQLGASSGFTVYSVMVDNLVFTVANALLVCFALAGLTITLRHRRRAAREGGEASGGGDLRAPGAGDRDGTRVSTDDTGLRVR